MPVSDALLEQATRWHARLADAPDDAGLLRAVEDWKGEHPDHVAAFLEAGKLWALLGPVPRTRRPPSRRAIGLGMAAAAVLAVFLVPGFGHALENWRSDVATPVGQVRTVDLPDGSHVTLSSDTALAYEAGPGGRTVRILRGEAFFAVEHDEARPFRVDAGNAQVTVLGTRFDVDLAGDRTRVTVESGKVRLDGPSGRAFLSADEQGVADAVQTVSRSVNAADATAWRSGRAVFFDAPLTEVARVLSRYRAAGIYVLGAKLRAQHVTASFRTDDDQGMIAALQVGTRAHVTTLPGGIVLLY